MSITNSLDVIAAKPSSFMDVVSPHAPWERKSILESYAGRSYETARTGTGNTTDQTVTPRRRQAEQVGLQARIALDRRTRADAFRLRHLCYKSKGFIDARKSGQFSDEYDDSPVNTTIVVYDGSRAVGSVRVCAGPKLTRPDGTDLPVMHVFPFAVGQLLQNGKRAIEINRLVRHPDYAQDQGLIFTLFRMCAYLIGRQNPDFILSCVRTNHMPFYRRLRFEQLAGPALYTGLKFTTNLMVLRRDKWDLINRLVPLLRLSPDTVASYDGLWSGDSVPVFGHE